VALYRRREAGGLPKNGIDRRIQSHRFPFRRGHARRARGGSPARHRAVGRRAVRESMVLLQNTNKVLPIEFDKASKKLTIVMASQDNFRAVERYAGGPCAAPALLFQANV